MKTIAIDRLRLLGIVKANFEEHQKEVAEAKAAYQEKLYDYAERFTSLLRSKVNAGELAANDLYVNMDLGLGRMPDEPRDHSDDYRRILDQLELCCEEEVVLEAHEFDSFARDEWDWKEHYRATNSMYSASLRGKMK